jgi:site-specific DNA-methyltransferase (adenine-specific)
MNTKSIIDNLKNKGIYLFKDGNNIRCRASKRVMTDDIRNQIRQHKKEILKLLIIENTYNLPVKISKAKFIHRICHQLLKLIEEILKLLGTGNPYNSPVKRPMTKPIQNNLPTNGSMIRLIQGDCLDALKNIEDDSVDQLVTDPPYGYKFMGKDWDKAVPSVEIWKECFRVLKPGAFAFIMASPRQDVLSRMIRILEEAGFVIGFTSLYWTYANGFPKAHNISKAIDKKLGAKREVINERTMPDIRGGNYGQGKKKYEKIVIQDTIPATPEARQLDGAYAGFQPKPAVEVILVVMKPCKEKNYTKQALADGKGITWLDNCRISYGDSKSTWKYKDGVKWSPEKKWNQNIIRQAHEKGRFPANLIVSDDILDDGKKHQGGTFPKKRGETEYFGLDRLESGISGRLKDSGGYSRFFSLDAWAEDLPKKVQQNLPFFIVPKASKKEKDAGCENFSVRKKDNRTDTAKGTMTKKGLQPSRNNHPTVKPLTLMSYLITMGSRPGDVVLDPFCGSGTTCIAAHKLQRRSIGIELNQQYFEIAAAKMRALMLEGYHKKKT